METQSNIVGLLGLILFSLIIYLYLSIHYKTKNKIIKWAIENQYEILWTKYSPWYWMIPWFAGGIHPSNFRVLVRRNELLTEDQITGGGMFLLSEKINVKKDKGS